MSMKRFSTRNIILLSVSLVIIAAIIIFCIFNWSVVETLFLKILSGTEIMKEYILDLGAIGVIACMLLIIFCFFFPFFSSLPVQIVCGITYGVVNGTIIVASSIAIASQLLYLFKQSSKIILNEKQLQKQQELSEKIRNSKRGIDFALIIAYVVPFIPFLIISNVAQAGLKYPKYLLYTTIGPIPEVIVTLYLGQALLSKSTLASIISLVFIIIVVVLSIIYNNRIIDFVFVGKKGKQDE